MSRGFDLRQQGLKCEYILVSDQAGHLGSFTSERLRKILRTVLNVGHRLVGGSHLQVRLGPIGGAGQRRDRFGFPRVRMERKALSPPYHADLSRLLVMTGGH